MSDADAHDPLVADEEEILAELQGKIFDKEKFVYKTKDGGFQLSYKGVQFACRQFAERGEAIEIPELARVMYDPENKEYILAQVRGQRVRIDQKTGQRIILDSALGSKRKWFKQKLRDGSAVEDPFFFEKAVSQAECAAKRKLLPQDWLLKFIKQILEQKPAQKSTDTTKTAGAGEKKGADQPSASSDKPKGSGGALGALRQQFWAVLKQATKSKDDASARKAIEALTGGSKVSAMDEPTLKKLGGILRKVVDGESSIKRDNGKVIIVHGPSGDVVWPEGYKSGEKKEPPKEESAAASAPGGGDWMF